MSHPTADVPRPRPLRVTVGVTAAILITISAILANWLTSRYGFIPVGFGANATAGTMVAGVALAARDAVHDLLGRRWMVVAFTAGAVASLITSDPAVAIASAAAFIAAELADWSVYAPLRRRGRLGSWWWVAAVAASGVVGAIVDTVIFVGLAFGAAAITGAIIGQLIGKAYAQIAYLILGQFTATALHRAPRP